MFVVQLIFVGLAFGIGTGIGLGIVLAVVMALSDDTLPFQKPYQGDQ